LALETRGHHKLWVWVALFIATGFPAVILRFSGLDIPAPLAALIFGIGIVGGAFLLSWAAEVAQMDISASLAIAVLALIAILPEYAIEAVLAMQAGASFNPELPVVTDEMARVAANVTGGQQASYWPGLVAGDSYLLAQAQAALGHAGFHGVGTPCFGDSHSSVFDYILHSTGASLSCGGANWPLPVLPVG